MLTIYNCTKHGEEYKHKSNTSHKMECLFHLLVGMKLDMHPSEGRAAHGSLKQHTEQKNRVMYQKHSVSYTYSPVSQSEIMHNQPVHNVQLASKNSV